MKIMSLNVNRFSGMGQQKSYAWDTDRCNELKDCPKAASIIESVKKFLGEESDGVVVLQEIPYCGTWDEKKQRLCLRAEERELYENFRKIFPKEQYCLSEPGKKALSCTLAIWNKDGGWEQEKKKDISNYFSTENTAANKVVGLVHKVTNLRLLGIHASDMYLLDRVKQYAKAHKDENQIIIGDYNISTNEWRWKEKKDDKEFCARRDWLLVDMTKKIGYYIASDTEKPTNLRNGETIDHILVSQALAKKSLADVKSKDDLSDHAVIIANIDVKD